MPAWDMSQVVRDMARGKIPQPLPTRKTSVEEAEEWILHILARGTQGRRERLPASVRYIVAYMSTCGWRGSWTDALQAVENLLQKGKITSDDGKGSARKLTLVDE